MSPHMPFMKEVKGVNCKIEKDRKGYLGGIEKLKKVTLKNE